MKLFAQKFELGRKNYSQTTLSMQFILVQSKFEAFLKPDLIDLHYRFEKWYEAYDKPPPVFVREMEPYQVWEGRFKIPRVLSQVWAIYKIWRRVFSRNFLRFASKMTTWKL